VSQDDGRDECSRLYYRHKRTGEPAIEFRCKQRGINQSFFKIKSNYWVKVSNNTESITLDDIDGDLVAENYGQSQFYINQGN